MGSLVLEHTTVVVLNIMCVIKKMEDSHARGYHQGRWLAIYIGLLINNVWR